MALAIDPNPTVVHSFITAHQKTGHRFEVDAEACLPTIRCWDFGTVEIIAQSATEIDAAASIASNEESLTVTVHVPSTLEPTARLAFESAGRPLNVQAYGDDDGAFRISHPAHT